jgi:hypothetical protein
MCFGGCKACAGSHGSGRTGVEELAANSREELETPIPGKATESSCACIIP